MKSIGIVICNYNKCEAVMKCIQSVLESKIQDFDIYVVDNASTDKSVESIQKQYNNQVNLLVNEENLGGSGGFNTGIHKVVEMGYEYLMCLDNDVQVDENAIEALHSFLQSHPEVGMVGSKVYHLNAPDYIQQFGLKIDFEHICAETLYTDVLDSENVPEVVYCDTVAACSVMLPVKVVKEVGGLPKDNFIYWDDMEWGYLIKKKGYKVAAYGQSCVLHAMGAMNRKNSAFTDYYLWRNYINFFMRYTPEDKLEKMSVKLLSSFFNSFYISLYLNQHNIAKTLMFAYQDALSDIRGKAVSGKILPDTDDESSFIQLIRSSDNYWMEEADSLLNQYIRKINPDIKEVDDPDKTKLRIKKCRRTMELADFSLKYCYIDKNYIAAVDQNDISLIQNYSFSLGMFLYMNQTQFLYEVRKLRDIR